MRTDRTEELVLTYVEDVWNNADATAFDRLTTASFAYMLGGQPARNKMAMLEFLKAVHTAFPDWRVRIEDMVINGPLAAVRWTGEVTHRGPFHGIPATGKRVSVSGINLYKIQDGLIAQEWEQMDSLGMLGQLGVLPPIQ